jgi:hypothetical protein
MSANTAALAIIQICLEISVFTLLNTSFGTEDIADAAFDAFGIIPDWPLRPPTSCMIFTGAARAQNNTPCCYFLPGSRPVFLCHNINTSILIT